MSASPRVFVDSNIFVSAARKANSDFLKLWDLPAAEFLFSSYVRHEASAHLLEPDQRARLWQLIYKSHLVPDGEPVQLPATVQLPEKDLPILFAAIAARADFLITGDLRHFSHLFGLVIFGVRIESSTMFKQRYPTHFTRGGQ